MLSRSDMQGAINLGGDYMDANSIIYNIQECFIHYFISVNN